MGDKIINSHCFQSKTFKFKGYLEPCETFTVELFCENS